MPFDYMHSTVPRSFSSASEKAEAQYLKELKDRAAMLHRLGYEKDAAVARLLGNVNWDWECSPVPSFVENLRAAVPKLVEEIFSKAPAPEKGRRVAYKDLKTLPSD